MEAKKRYFLGNGEEQAKLDEMNADAFQFLGESEAAFKSYKKYYNGGFIPGWAKSRHDITEHVKRGHHYILRLTERGEQEQEEHMTAIILTEYIRFKRWQKLNKK